MNLENLTSAQVQSIELYAEQVERSAKYMADVGIWSEDEIQDVLGDLNYLASQRGLRVFLQDYEDDERQLVAVYFYKYMWVQDILEFLTAYFPPGSENESSFHAICGLVYGYGPAEIEEFVSKQQELTKARKIFKGAVEEVKDGDIDQ